tara:strand:+ start:340 stop:1449 length:1110 start_codon:yes stop_codon:yes gene_type:complete
MNPYCPHCPTTALVRTRYARENIDSCPSCEGLWFQNHELNSAIADFDNGDDDPDFISNLGAPLGISDRSCPSCNEKMQCYHLLPDYQVEVDICHPCNSTWIDKHELDEVCHSPLLKEALAEINQGVSWKSWLFEFLARMPVEYNVRPRITPFVTWIILALNIVIFSTYATDPELMNSIFALFASRPADIVHGVHIWTLITATFLHGGFMHLVGNMYFLWVVGDNIESMVGHKRYLGIYLLLGLGASLYSVIGNPLGTIPSVGASGAIAGLFGLYMLWFPYARFSFMIVAWQIKLPVWVYFLGWLGLNFLGMVTSGGGVDYRAHIGGFFIGCALALVMKKSVYAQNPLIAMLAGSDARFRKPKKKKKPVE